MHVFRILAPAALVLAAGVLSSCGSSSEGNSAIPNYSMGERAQAGTLIYTVFETKAFLQLGSGESARIPGNRFLLLRMSIVNSGSADTTAPALTLVDDSGQRYPELSNGEGVPQWVGFIRRVKPADTLTGNIVFDAPLRHYKLEIADETMEKKATVDIPVSFGESAIDVPMPVPGATPPETTGPK